MKPVLWLLTASVIIGGSLGLSIEAHAEDGCLSQPWGFLGSETRQLCDGPILADGSWWRERIIGHGAYWTYPRSSCYGGIYYSNCTFYPSRYVEEYHSNEERYIVTPDTILPDEPGHIG